jgi:hypothetical protein
MEFSCPTCMHAYTRKHTHIRTRTRTHTHTFCWPICAHESSHAPSAPLAPIKIIRVRRVVGVWKHLSRTVMVRSQCKDVRVHRSMRVSTPARGVQHVHLCVWCTPVSVCRLALCTDVGCKTWHSISGRAMRNHKVSVHATPERAAARPAVRRQQREVAAKDKN